MRLRMPTEGQLDYTRKLIVVLLLVLLVPLVVHHVWAHPGRAGEQLLSGSNVLR